MSVKSALNLKGERIKTIKESFLYCPGNNKKAAFLQLLWYAISFPFDFLTIIQNKDENNILKMPIPKTHGKKFLGFMKAVLFMFDQRLMSKQCGEILKCQCRLKNLKIEGLSSGEGIKLCLFNWNQDVV